jgi:hypothetical protein
MEFGKGEYVNINTGKTPPKEEIEAFKIKVLKNKKNTEKSIKDKNNTDRKFVDKHRKLLKEYTGDDRLNNYDRDDCIYLLSTALFDCWGTGRQQESFLDEIEKEFGRDFYLEVIDGFVRGLHDT